MVFVDAPYAAPYRSCVPEELDRPCVLYMLYTPSAALTIGIISMIELIASFGSFASIDWMMLPELRGIVEVEHPNCSFKIANHMWGD